MEEDFTPLSEYVYLLWDPRNGEIRYVGKTSNLRRVAYHQNICSTRWPCHCFNWKKEMRGAGVHCEYSVVEEGLTPQEANAKEKWWIAYGRACGWPLTNHTDGGEGATGLIHTAEVRAKISAGLRGKRLTAKHRAKLSAAKKGHKRRPFSEEHKAKISAALRTVWIQRKQKV